MLLVARMTLCSVISMQFVWNIKYQYSTCTVNRFWPEPCGGNSLQERLQNTAKTIQARAVYPIRLQYSGVIYSVLDIHILIFLHRFITLLISFTGHKPY